MLIRVVPAEILADTPLVDFFHELKDLSSVPLVSKIIMEKF